jgi:simple sugar transport system substrate-binding protein
MARFAPATQLSSDIDDWAPYYVARIQAVLDGSWASEDTWGGFDSGMLQMTPFANMPDDLAAKASALVADLRSGKASVFAGPIADQSGAVKAPAGATLDDAALASMQWLSAGIEGRLS